MSSEHSSAHEHHGPSLGTIFGIFGTLMVLTGLTIAVAYQDLGRFSAFVAVAIASFKASLVIFYFMHVKYSSRLIALYALGGFAFVAIMLTITLGEVAGRPDQQGFDPLRPNAPAPFSPRRFLDEEPP